MWIACFHLSSCGFSCFIISSQRLMVPFKHMASKSIVKYCSTYCIQYNPVYKTQKRLHSIVSVYNSFFLCLQILIQSRIWNCFYIKMQSLKRDSAYTSRWNMTYTVELMQCVTMCTIYRLESQGKPNQLIVNFVIDHNILWNNIFKNTFFHFHERHGKKRKIYQIKKKSGAPHVQLQRIERKVFNILIFMHIYYTPVFCTPRSSILKQFISHPND